MKNSTISNSSDLEKYVSPSIQKPCGCKGNISKCLRTYIYNSSRFGYTNSADNPTSIDSNKLKTSDNYITEFAEAKLPKQTPTSDEITKNLSQIYDSSYRIHGNSHSMADSTTSCNFPEEKIEKEKEEYFLQIHKEAEEMFKEHIIKLNAEAADKLAQETEKLKANYIYEMQTTKEKGAYKTLIEQLRPKVESELKATLRIELEPFVRTEIENKVKQSFEDKYNKQTNIAMRKLKEKESIDAEKIQQQLNANFIKEVEEQANKLALAMNKEFQIKYRKQSIKEMQELYDKLVEKAKTECQLEKDALKQQKIELAQTKSKQSIYMAKIENERNALANKCKILEEQLKGAYEAILAKDNQLHSVMKIHTRSNSVSGIKPNKTMSTHNTIDSKIQSPEKPMAESKPYLIQQHDSKEVMRQLMRSAEEKAKTKQKYNIKAQSMQITERDNIIRELECFKNDIKDIKQIIL